MDPKEEKSLSKYVSLVLRHRPEVAKLQPDEQGWVLVEDLIGNSRALGTRDFSLEQLKQVVANNSKQRFEFDESSTKIRARQGHSISVDLGYTPTPPPALLYHGTVEKAVYPIMQTGINKQKRHHVHLSPDKETARIVGSRHGKLALLQVDAAAMHADGHVFYVTENKVWLCEAVPPTYITQVQE